MPATLMPDRPTLMARLATLILPLFAGALAAGGFQPVALWPLTLFGLALLTGLVHRAPGPRAAALTGWLWGVGHFALGNNWIATAFTYQAQMPAWLGGIAVVTLALYLAVYPALAAWAAWHARRRGPSLVLGLAAAWIVSEWLRGRVFTGFPWNPLAASALGGADRAGLAQVLPWTGTYALSGLVALLGGLWWLAWHLRVARPLVALVLGLVPLVAGRLPQGSAPAAPGAVAYTLVQPGIAQEALDDPALYESQFATTARLSARQAGQGARRLVLWPESGLPDYLREGYPPFYYEATTFAADPRLARARIARVIGPQGLLLTGSVDLVLAGQRAVAARNVVTAVDGAGAIRGSYAKAHLVPYGEYLPMRALLEPLGLSRLVPGSFDFLPGPGPRTIDLRRQGLGQAGVQICYEIVFSGAVADPAHRPDYLFNPTNDGWFGTWGPPQHLAQARLRAIEEGLPVLRATTNGISAVIDARGRVVHSLPRPVAGRIDGTIPPASAPTLFARLGNGLALAWAALIALCAVLALKRRRG